VVLGERQGDRRRAVAQREQRALRAGHPLLEHERARRGADRRLGLGVVGRDGDTLAGVEAVELDDDGPAQRLPPLEGGIDLAGVEAGVGRTGDAERRRQLTGVGLRRLEQGEVLARAEAGDAARRADVGGTGDEHGLGSRDHEVGREVVELVEVGDDGDVVAHPATGPGDGVLAAAGADDHHPHVATPDPAAAGWVMRGRPRR
jgi:hypothetical protein